MSAFEQNPPALSAAEMQDLLDRHWGLAGTVTPLASERDQNARVEASGERYVLKIVNPAEDREFVDLQNAVIAHLAGVGMAGVPRLIPTRQGSAMAETLVEGRPAMVRLVSYLDGRVLSGVPKSAALLADLGRFMGRLSAGLQGFGHRAAHRPDFLWSLDSAEGIAGFIPDIIDPARRALVAHGE